MSCKTDLMQMTANERIAFRKENWRGNTFGKSEGFYPMPANEEVFMEMINPPRLAEQVSKILEKGGEKKVRKTKKKFNWKPIHDLFDSVYTIIHRMYDKDNEPIVEYNWMDSELFVDEYFSLLASEEKMRSYIKNNIDIANLRDENANLKYNEDEESGSKEKDDGVYRPKFRKGSEPSIDKRNLIVFNLPRDITESEMIRFFSVHGDIRRATIMMDKRTGKPRGFGFVNTYSEKTAEKIVENCNKRPFKHNIIEVKYSDKSKGKKR